MLAKEPAKNNLDSSSKRLSLLHLALKRIWATFALKKEESSTFS